MKLPITLIIPSLMVVSTAITSLVLYQNNISSESDRLREQAIKELKLDMSRLQNIFYNQLTEDKLADARINLSITAMKPNTQVLILVNEDNKVIAANQFGWVNSSAEKVGNYTREIADKVKRDNQPEIFYSKNNSNILNGYFSVVLNIESQKGIPRNAVGALYSEINISKDLIDTQSRALNQSLWFGVSMLAATLLVSLLLHFLISRRLGSLTQASESLSHGHLDTFVKISGNDEITQLANSFNEMVLQLKKAFNSRENAKRELVDLNASLEVRVDERTKLLNQAQEIAKMGNWVWDLSDNKQYWSDEIYKIFGVAPGECSPDFDMFISFIHPDDMSMVKAEIELVFEQQNIYKVEHRIVWEDGSVHWVRAEAVLNLFPDNRPDKMTGILQDITDERNKIKEKEKLEFELQQMQKMESLGQLTGGIAHDFNNMLAIIMGYNELSQTIATRTNDEKLAGYLGQIQISSKRASELVQQMLAFSRASEDSGKKENIVLTQLLSEISLMLKPLLSSSIILNIQSEDDYTIDAEAAMLNQVIMNLCLNAKDAMYEGQGHIDIDVSKVTLAEKQCSSCFKEISGEFVQVSIKDNGVGMSEKELHRIFEPFFTTKEVGKGSGMGLAMVHGIVHKNQGHIIVDSKEGYGSTIKLLFPVIETIQHQSIHHNLQKENLIENDGSILIVDDEEAISLFLKEFLESKGYKTSVTNNSKKALEYFISNHKKIDLVITDFTMPGMTGFQLAEYMLTHDPEIPIILCSGYSENISKEKALSKNIKAYIEKPINTDQLLIEIKKHIRDSSSLSANN